MVHFGQRYWKFFTINIYFFEFLLVNFIVIIYLIIIFIILN